MSQRLFAGVALDDAARAAIDGAVSAARSSGAPGLRWLPVASWHLTLQFLGAVGEDRVAAVGQACARAAAGQPAFDIELSGAGAFGSPHRARVVWIGLRRGGEPMRVLYERLLAETEPLGFSRDERAYSAHITVARIKQPANVERVLARLQLPAQPMRVTALALFRSHLSSQGARYEVLASYPLAAAGGAAD